MEKKVGYNCGILQPKEFNRQNLTQETNGEINLPGKDREEVSPLKTTTMSRVAPSGKKVSLSIQGSRKGQLTMARRNARERNRVKQVNQGFVTLRHHIPEEFRLKKMSKVDTLRCALEYIRSMEQILIPSSPSSPSAEHYAFLPESSDDSLILPEGINNTPPLQYIYTEKHFSVEGIKMEPQEENSSGILNEFQDENMKH